MGTASKKSADVSMREEVDVSAPAHGNDAGIGSSRAAEQSAAVASPDEHEQEERRTSRWRRNRNRQSYSHTHYKVYKRRWFGLLQLVLLNVVVSWDVCVSLLRSPDCVLARGH